MVNFLEPQGPSPQVLTLMGGVRFIAWRLRYPFLGECRRGLRHFGECWMHLGSGPVPGPTLKKALCHTCPFGGAVHKYRLISPCFMLRFFSRLFGICARRLIPRASGVCLPQALTLLKGVRFIPWHLKHPSLGECQQGPRHFWSYWTLLDHSTAPKKALCHTCPSGGMFLKYRLISLCLVQRLFFQLTVDRGAP